MAPKRQRSSSSELEVIASNSNAAATIPNQPIERFYPEAGPTPRKPKKGEEGYGQPQEKRLKMYKKACPQATRERMYRVMSQRFFCVARTRTGETSEEFSVLGSTGNAYTITIDNLPRCNCPDGTKGNHCKHILFVFLKVLQVPQSSNLWYQSALLTTELRAIFVNARPAPRTQLEERVSKMYRVATGKEKAEDQDGDGSSAGGVKKRIPQEGDSCPICYEDFTAGSATGLVFCLSINGCGNALHSECFSNWAKTAKPVTCPLCREKWTNTGANVGGSTSSQAGPMVSRDGYLNYAAQAGMSTKRDTSTYYNGPRKGKKGWGSRGRYGGFGGYPDDFEDDEFGGGYEDDYEEEW